MDIFLQNAIEKITEQQGKKENTIIFCIGEQLKDICKNTPGAAELMTHDLEIEGMSISDVEKKITAYASKNKNGNCGCCSPNAADNILRKFYGIASNEGASKKVPKSISLTDFM